MEKNGVWRTIKGRHIFIEDGQSLSDALKKNRLQTKKKSKEEDEYELYKRAYENPDSIDPMTENSTDWEALDRKYANRYSMEKGNEDFVVKGTPKAVSPKEELARIREYDPEYNDDDFWYFGKEAYTKHGDALRREYAGKTISKRIADGNNENGLSTVAKQIGAKDEYEVVEALEGMVRNGKAQEIDDSTYKIIGTEINDLKPEAINDIKLDSINETKLEPKYGTLVRNGTQYNVTDHIDEHSYKGIGAAGHSFVGIEKEKYKIENPNDKSDWGWVYKEEYDKLTAKSKLKSLNDLIQSYMARGYSKETAKKLARNDMNKRKK